MCLCVYTHVYDGMDVCTNVRPRIHAHTHAHIHMHTHIHTHIHTQGIAIRSNGAAISYRNRIERNRLVDLGQSTRDLGGLSFIGSGHTLSVVRHNCVKRVTGVDTDPHGRFNTPFFTWGVYLDNLSSNFTIDSNILHTNVLGAVFIHGGYGNKVTNNIAFNTSNATMPGPGLYGHCDGARGLLLGSLGPGTFPMENSWERNIVLADTDDRMSIVGVARLNFSNFIHQLTFNRNIYFSPYRDLSSANDTTPLGDWGEWQRGGWDVDSKIADPMFLDVKNGNFGLDPNSPALKVGFIALPPGIDQC